MSSILAHKLKNANSGQDYRQSPLAILDLRKVNAEDQMWLLGEANRSIRCFAKNFALVTVNNIQLIFTPRQKAGILKTSSTAAVPKVDFVPDSAQVNFVSIEAIKLQVKVLYLGGGVRSLLISTVKTILSI